MPYERSSGNPPCLCCGVAREITDGRNETIGRWLRVAAQQAEAITKALVLELYFTEWKKKASRCLGLRGCVGSVYVGAFESK